MSKSDQALRQTENIYMTDGTYPTTLHRLLAEMDALTPEQIAASAPQSPVARSEKEIGNPLSEPLRALWALHGSKVERFNALVLEHEAMHEAVTEEAPLDRVKHTKLHKEIQTLGEEVQVLEHLFWRSVRENYEVDPEGNGVGLRAGWQVVDMYGGQRSVGILEMLLGGRLSALFR